MRQQTHSNPFTRLLVATFTAIALIAMVMAVSASTASAEIDDGVYTTYTTEDLCEITVSPNTATVNANGTQTFTIKFGTSANANAIFEEGGIPPRIAAENPELPETISYYDTISACVYNEVALMAGLLIRFEVISGPDAGKVFETELAADGTATFPLVNNGQLGTDQVRITALLPQICVYAMKDVGVGDPWDWGFATPEGCEEIVNSALDPESLATGRVRPVDFGFLDPVVISALGQVTWIAPPTPPAAVVAVKSFKSCVSNRIRIRPTYSSGMRSSRLVVDGKTVARKSDSSAYIINPTKYKPGKHRFRVIATYDSGSVTSNTGTFNRCKVKVSVKRVKPKFTG